MPQTWRNTTLSPKVNQNQHLRNTQDATTWRLGQKNVHLLVLSFLYQGVAIPILWRDLDKKGHSNARERQSFMEEAAQLYNLKGKILLADREYTGQLWFTFLHQQGIDCAGSPVRDSATARVLQT